MTSDFCSKKLKLLYRKEKKKTILDALDILDKKSEQVILTPQELSMKRYLNNRLVVMLREEEIKWYQRSKSKQFLEGDTNTKYFHLLANGRHRKTHIFQLKDGE